MGNHEYWCQRIKGCTYDEGHAGPCGGWPEETTEKKGEQVEKEVSLTIPEVIGLLLWLEKVKEIELVRYPYSDVDETETVTVNDEKLKEWVAEYRDQTGFSAWLKETGRDITPITTDAEISRLVDAYRMARSFSERN